MSFRDITQKSPQAGALLQLFAFLNPDSILVDFLKAGAKGLDDELQQVIATGLSDALFELSRHSLIDRSNKPESIMIHRLVQAAIKEQMSPAEIENHMSVVAIMFLAAFPDVVTNETRPVCRLYQGQIIEPLMNHINIISTEVAIILLRVGEFLRSDGVYQESVRLLRRAVTVCRTIYGENGTQALAAMGALAETYWSTQRGNAPSR